jgi:hypothetical protein
MELFHGQIKLPSIAAGYASPSFAIYTPANPQQLVATYPASDGNHDNYLDVEINPLGTNRFGPIIEETEIAGVNVAVAETPSNDRRRYYWSWNGWQYTLEAPVGTTANQQMIRSILGDYGAAH